MDRASTRFSIHRLLTRGLGASVDTDAQRGKAGRLARDAEALVGVENLIKVGDLRT